MKILLEAGPDAVRRWLGVRVGIRKKLTDA